MSPFNGAIGSQSSLREANSARIIEAIKHYGQITQVELAAVTSLSPATISNIVKQLVANNIVQTDTTIRSGRRAQLVSMAVSNGLSVGVQIGHRHLALEISDETHEVTAHHRLPLPAQHRVDTTLDRVALLVMELAEEVGSSLESINSIGVCLPAPIDPDTGITDKLLCLEGWDNLNIRDVLEARLQRPIIVENDANAGVVGESRFGALRGINDALYIHASRSIGAGILVGGRIHHGYKGMAGEISHVQVDPNGLVCRCGARGCLETIVGVDALLSLLRLHGTARSLSDLVAAAQAGDAGCRRIISDAATTIGNAIADLAIVFAPKRIVFGGDLPATGDLFFNPIRDIFSKRPAIPPDVDIVASSLDGRAEVLGVLALARDAFQTSPTRSPLLGGTP